MIKVGGRQNPHEFGQAGISLATRRSRIPSRGFAREGIATKTKALAREIPPATEARREEECIIHCCNDTGELETLKDLESWKTLLNAATIRNHEPILEIAKTLEEGELPKVTYHRQCRSIFTLKRNLDKLSQLDAKERANCKPTDSRRSSIRQPTANPSRIYQRVCIFCEKDKYTRNSRTREELIQCVDMRADETIKKAAVRKNDHRILAVVSRELVAAEACYHKSCYRNYTRNIPVSGDKKEDSEYTEYS